MRRHDLPFLVTDRFWAPGRTAVFSDAPRHWMGVSHGTIFKARPNEKLKGAVLMPVEAARRKINALVGRLKDRVKG